MKKWCSAFTEENGGEGKLFSTWLGVEEATLHHQWEESARSSGIRC